MTRKTIQLHAAIVDPDAAAAQSVRDVIESVGRAEGVEWFDGPEETLRALERSQFNALFVDIFSLGTDRGIELIEVTRERHSHVPICLVGTREQLATFPGVPDKWKKRFGHFYWLAKDLLPAQRKRDAVAALERMEFYLLSKSEKDRLRHVRDHLARYGSDPTRSSHETQEAMEAIEFAEHALDTRRESIGAQPNIIPGFGNDDIQALIKETLERSSSALRRTATVNTAVLAVGAGLVISSFVVASIVESWEPVVFGGFGIAGIIASLITNPLKAIANEGRNLVQIQVAYQGFLNQLSMLAGLRDHSDAAVVIERSKQINDATTSILEALKKHYG